MLNKKSKIKHREPVEQEESAGGIVLKRSKNRLLIAIMKDSYGKWTFPKGHVENGEELEEARRACKERLRQFV